MHATVNNFAVLNSIYQNVIDSSLPQPGLVSPTLDQQVSFLNGLSLDNTINNNSYWGGQHLTAHKFGDSKAGTGAAVTYAFDPTSGFSLAEQATVMRAFATWSGVADVQFTETTVSSSADVLIQRGNDGLDHTSSPRKTSTLGSGSTLGQMINQVIISTDTSISNFELSSSLNQDAGHGFGAIVHEIGHALGLGHGGAYNAVGGSSNFGEQQFSAYDDRMWTVMSYLSWASSDLKFKADYTVKETEWGYADGIRRVSPQTLMQLDILAIQQLYGKASSANTPFAGGQTYGFNSSITGALADIYDFSFNTQPVVTLYNQGHNNTLDLSGFTENSVINLSAGNFSSAGGLINNIFIDRTTVIERAIGGSGKNKITGNEFANVLEGGVSGDVLDGSAGADRMIGHHGNDVFYVDNSRDRAIERAGEGDDIVFTSVDYKLRQGDSIESLAAKVLNPTDGLKLVGNELDQSLRGDNGNDILNGGGGSDRLYGYDGDDKYLVYSQNDQIFESREKHSGLDTAVAFSSYELGLHQGIEILKLGIATGTADFSLTGNKFHNVLRGNGGDNSLDGRHGSDILSGLGGQDTFVFSTSLSGRNVDRITDFTSGEDMIHLDHSIFKVLSPGGLSAHAFKELGGSNLELDDDDRLIYDQSTGTLYYDVDGSGTAQAIRVAVLTNRADVSFHDIFVV